MVETGQQAPDFTAPMASGSGYDDVDSFTLSAALAGGPVVLAFVPAAFTNGCTRELCTFRDSMDRFDELDAAVYGVSVDLPFSQNVWIHREDLDVPMISDWNHDVIRKYDVVRNDLYGMIETAARSVFVVDTEQTVTYRRVCKADSPDFATLVSETQDAVAKATRS